MIWLKIGSLSSRMTSTPFFMLPTIGPLHGEQIADIHASLTERFDTFLCRLGLFGLNALATICRTSCARTMADNSDYRDTAIFCRCGLRPDEGAPEI